MHFSGIVGRSMKDRIDAELTFKALQNAFARRKIKSGFHMQWYLDRESQYASLQFQTFLKTFLQAWKKKVKLKFSVTFSVFITRKENIQL